MTRWSKAMWTLVPMLLVAAGSYAAMTTLNGEVMKYEIGKTIAVKDFTGNVVALEITKDTKVEGDVRVGSQVLIDALPKQYVPLYGTQSLLERTFKRVERLVPPDRIMTVVTRNHLRYADAFRQLARRPTNTVVVQHRPRTSAAARSFATAVSGRAGGRVSVRSLRE